MLDILHLYCLQHPEMEKYPLVIANGTHYDGSAAFYSWQCYNYNQGKMRAFYKFDSKQPIIIAHKNPCRCSPTVIHIETHLHARFPLI